VSRDAVQYSSSTVVLDHRAIPLCLVEGLHTNSSSTSVGLLGVKATTKTNKPAVPNLHCCFCDLNYTAHLSCPNGINYVLRSSTWSSTWRPKYAQSEGFLFLWKMCPRYIDCMNTLYSKCNLLKFWCCHMNQYSSLVIHFNKLCADCLEQKCGVRSPVFADKHKKCW
jgi:hypothetical protein